MVENLTSVNEPATLVPYRVLYIRERRAPLDADHEQLSMISTLDVRAVRTSDLDCHSLILKHHPKPEARREPLHSREDRPHSPSKNYVFGPPSWAGRRPRIHDR